MKGKSVSGNAISGIRYAFNTIGKHISKSQKIDDSLLEELTELASVIFTDLQKIDVVKAREFDLFMSSLKKTITGANSAICWRKNTREDLNYHIMNKGVSKADLEKKFSEFMLCDIETTKVTSKLQIMCTEGSKMAYSYRWISVTGIVAPLGIIKAS
ncbi:hypothetical protein [Vibrio sp. D431a]|uniref:hypothetical protein n=1 Tax=Vibrio sp. D431a TaxID=2837388 RepID=UPI0025565049|nr:hypothetical protein [Vibrio sp. D431a]MDK9789859.1 hypothetical protein [Vibrio sp. D431a]